jgi:hypothetical protein
MFVETRKKNRSKIYFKDYMSDREIELMLYYLSEYFDVKTPTFSHIESGYCRYVYWSNNIEIGRGYKNHVGLVDSILHEFTHILNEGNLLHHGRKRYDHHGMHFQNLLCEVINFWYGNLYDYNWKCEYDIILKNRESGLLAYRYNKYINRR